MVFTKKPRRARRRYFGRSKRRGHKDKKISIAMMASLAPPAFHFISWVKDPLLAGNYEGAMYNGAYSILKDFTGYDLNQQKFDFGPPLATYLTIVAGIAGHKLANKFGVNKQMAKIPIIGRYLNL